MIDKKRDGALDAFRGLAMLAVLMIHVTADYAYAAQTSPVFAVMNVVNKLFYWAVPAFVTLTVYLALRGGRKLGLRYVLRHSGPVLGLYILWSGVYLAFQRIAYGQPLPGLKELILDIILQGKACYHLYYVVMLIQLYVVIALLSRLPLKKLRPAPWMPWAAILLQLLTLAGFVKLIIQRFWFYNTAIFPVFYILPITLGLMLAADSERTKAYFRRWSPALGICMGFALACSAWFSACGGAAFQGGVFSGPLFNTGTGALLNLGAIPLAFILAEKLKDIRPLTALGRRSLTVYFAHPLVLYLMDAAFDFRSGGPSLLLAGIAVKAAAIVALALCYACLAEKVKSKKS